MGITEFKQKELPHLTPVVMLCAAFVAGSVGPALILLLKEMQEKAKATGLDWFDFAILLVFMTTSILANIGAFMSKRYGQWADERAQAKKIETEHVKWVKEEMRKAEKAK